MSAPTLPITGIKVLRGRDAHSQDNVITWTTPTESGVTHVEVWATNTIDVVSLVATVSAAGEPVVYDPGIYLQDGVYRGYMLRATNAEGEGPFTNFPSAAPTLPIEGIQVFRGWDENRISGDHRVDNIITWYTPTEVGVTHVEVWSRSYTLDEMYLLATVATDVEQITADTDIYTILRNLEFQTYTLRAKNEYGYGPWSNTPRAVKQWDGNPNHPEDQNEIGVITHLELIGSDVKITWMDPANSPNGSFVSGGADIYRSIAGGAFSIIGRVTTPGTYTYTDTTIAALIQPGQVIQYAIALLDERGIGPATNNVFPFLPRLASNKVLYIQNAGTEGVGFINGFFSGGRLKLNWGFLKAPTGTVFTIQRARPNPSGNPDRIAWNTYASIDMSTAYVSDLDSTHGIYEYTYTDDISTQWSFRIKATTLTGAEFFSTPFFLAPAAATLVVNHSYARYYTFSVGHPSFAESNVQSYYKILKAYKSVNGGAFTLLWTLTNPTINPNFPNWSFLPVGGSPTNGAWLGSYLIPSPPSQATEFYRSINAGVQEGTIQFKVVVSATDNFDGLTTTTLSPVYSFDQLS